MRVVRLASPITEASILAARLVGAWTPDGEGRYIRRTWGQVAAEVVETPHGATWRCLLTGESGSAADVATARRRVDVVILEAGYATG
jgi:hypothetical protein